MATSQAPGNDLKKRHEVIGKMPIIETPYSRVSEHWWTFQGGPCADAEMDFALCSARVGVNNAASVCKQYHDDLMECAYRVRTLKRYSIMQEERLRQGRPFLQTPAPDSFRTWTKVIEP